MSRIGFKHTDDEGDTLTVAIGDNGLLVQTYNAKHDEHGPTVLLDPDAVVNLSAFLALMTQPNCERR